MIFYSSPLQLWLPFAIMLAGCSVPRVPGWLDDQPSSEANDGISARATSSGVEQPESAEMLLDQQRRNDTQWGIVREEIPPTTELSPELEEILVKRGMESMYLERYGLAGVTASAAPILNELCPNTIEIYKRLGQLPRPVLPNEEQQQRINACRARKEYLHQVAARAYGPPEGFGPKTKQPKK